MKTATAGSASYDSVIGTYYNYTVIKNGELIENFKVRNTDITGYTLYTSVEYDTDGVAKLGGGITGGKVTTDAANSTDYATILTNKAGIGVTNDGTVQASNDVIGLGSYFYGYNANSKVFFINSDGEVSTSSIGSIGTDADDDVYFTLTDDGEIQYLFVVQNGVGTGSVPTTAGKLDGNVLSVVNPGAATQKLQVAVSLSADATISGTAQAYFYNTYTGEWVAVGTPAPVVFTAADDVNVDVLANAGMMAGTNLYKVVVTRSDGSTMESNTLAVATYVAP